jgi:peptidoglycan hydrolase CwlO-like protein
MKLGKQPFNSPKKLFALSITGLFFMLVAGAAITNHLLVAYAQNVTAATTTPSTIDSSSTQAAIDTNNAQIATLNQQIAAYQTALTQVGANKKTLQAAINSLDLQKSKVQAQVSITEHQMANTQLTIQQLGTEISSTQQTISTDQSALAEELRSLQKSDDKPLIMQVLSTGSLIQTWSDLAADVQVKDSVQNQMQILQTQEDNLSTSQNASEQQQSTLTSQQQSLASQQQSLVQTEQSKAQLLAETNSQEATYEKLLAAAQAQLASFSTFAENAGGSKLLGNQTVCDSWGCYYNQRDTAWGNDKLNGTQYNLASDGCLISALAMVMTHYGYKDVTPVTINSNPANFASYYPAYLLTTVNIDGATVTRKTATIDATLATGNPVIVGINAYGGTHYVVLVSGSKGNYIMKDPYIANGNNVSFTANYSLKSIFGISKVVITT